LSPTLERRAEAARGVTVVYESFAVWFSRLLKKSDSCFDRLSTNGKSPTIASLPPFALSLSKGERRVFQQPVRRMLNKERSSLSEKYREQL